MIRSSATLWSTTFVLLQAPAVFAQAPNAAPAANGQSLTETTHANGPSEQFGQKGQIAVSSDNSLTISNTSTNGVSGSTTAVELEPAIDYFIIRNFSIGGFIEFNYTSAANGHSSRFGVGPRVGYNFTLSDLISIWPKAGLSIGTKSNTSDPLPGSPPGTPSVTGSATNVQLNLFVPIMFHPAPHFFAGFGPFLDVDLSGDAKATTYGAKMTLGGWVM